VEARVAETVPDDAAEVFGRRRLCQFLEYAKKVFDLDALLGAFRDRRAKPKVGTALVVRALFLLGLLRVRSFNAFEPKLAEPWLQRALGLNRSRKKAVSVDTLSYSLRRMDVSTARSALTRVVQKAERNKVFREGWHHAMRFVALDGWEPFCSYVRHCPACLTREVTVGNEVRTQYYHRCVVALLLGKQLEVVLDFEPILSVDVRRERGQKDASGHEGELTAAKRLVQRLRTTYGGWLDVIVGDALYANGPFLSIAKQCGYGAIVVLKKEGNEPLQEALEQWGASPPHQVVCDADKNERVDLWDCKDTETLSTYRDKIRVVRAVVHKQRRGSDAVAPTTWCFAATGKAMRMNVHRVALAGRGRWHIENTGFYQWANYWRFSHVFTHGKDALPALFYIFFLAFNLLQLFLYRQIGGYGRARGADVTRTIWRLVDEMNDDLARLTDTLVWDTS
jgi:hypothetical protein